jgi:hypothetical protein
MCALQILSKIPSIHKKTKILQNVNFIGIAFEGCDATIPQRVLIQFAD